MTAIVPGDRVKLNCPKNPWMDGKPHPHHGETFTVLEVYAGLLRLHESDLALRYVDCCWVTLVPTVATEVHP